MDPNALASQITQLDQSYNPTDTYNKITASLGIPDARTRVQALQKNLLDTENAIRAVDPSVTARTSNALVSEAQRGRLVNMEKAPLTDTYSQQNQQYGQQQSLLNDLTGQATTQAQLAEATYKTKRQSLADQLNLALQAQKDAEDKRRWEAEMAYKASSGGGGGGGGGGGAAKAPTASSQQRKDGGFNFQNASGQAISARLYAQLTGTNFNTLLKKMAAAGDKGAADVLKNGGSSKAYKALTWN